MIKLTLFSCQTLTSLLGLLALLVDFSSAQGAIDNDFPLTHAKLVELSAIKHLCRRLPVEIKCSAFKDKLREIAVKDDGSLFRLTIEAIRSKRVPFKNNKYLVSDLETCKRLLGPTEELQGEALAYAKLRAVTRELEQLKEVLKFKEQSKEERDRPIHSVPDQAKLAFKLLGSEIYISSYMERCYVYYILFGKQRPLSTQDIESAVRMQPGLSIFKAPPTVSAATKQSLKELSEHLMQYQSMEYSNPAEEIRSCIDDLKTIN